MAILLDPPTRVRDELSEALDAGITGPERRERRGWGRPAYRCPDCGTLEHTDSVIPGCCPVCPGLVTLEAA
jgi:rubrerythrin